ncbi:Sporulation related domain-containing protein [Daejeonella rubra]|uniref:Sporulation related domain-containing protein n=1 Tax=Daejeonella rubra TaxID=990371 RepID=A0A1G9PA64_9SPHI|nr:SPOR domain-containing protein [Daejeonella rubra]SDL95686.1 Sporulation related domain-containing protein [Daejeonella rubra]
MEIGLYIEDLLREQDEVSVSGLGTFKKVRLAGTFDRSSNIFYPPSYLLSFIERETSDSSLSQYISIKKSLSISSVEELIKKLVSGIVELLNSSDSVEILHIGVLHKKNGKLTLIAADDFGTTDNFFGLKPIAELKNENSIPVQEEKEIAAPVISEEKEEEEEEEEEDEDYEEIKKTRSWITIFASFLAFLIALSALFYFNTDFNSFIKNKSAGVFSSANTVQEPSTDLIDSTKLSSDSIKNAVDSASILADSIRQKSDTTIAVANAPAAVAATSESESINYEIIAAAFARKSEAEVYILELSTKGIQAKIVENMPGKMLKISLGTFLDEESAKKELTRIQKNINKDAWIARVKQSKNP